MADAVEFCADIAKFPSQLVELENDFLNFQHHRTGDAQIARAVLACDGFILDDFSAERALHQTGRRFLPRLRLSSSRLAANNSSRAASRFRRRSSRSSISETGTAMSRAQEMQTSATEAFSCAQNGQVIDIG